MIGANKMNVIGIDPGITGGLAIFKDDVLSCHIMPSQKINASKFEIDISEVDCICAVNMPDLVVMEDVGSNPKWRKSSIFTFGKAYGMLLALLRIRKYSHILVKPVIWKRTMLAGTDKSKEAAIAKVQHLYPQINTKSHDVAEATLLALYGRERVLK